MSVKATIGVLFGVPLLLLGGAAIVGVLAIVFANRLRARSKNQPILQLRATFHSDHDFTSPEYLASVRRGDCNRYPDAFFAVLLRTTRKARQDAIRSCRKGDELSLRFDRMNACVWVLRGDECLGHLRKSVLRQIAWRVEKRQYRCVFYKAIVTGAKARATAHVYLWNHKDHPELEKVMDDHYELADKR